MRPLKAKALFNFLMNKSTKTLLFLVNKISSTYTSIKTQVVPFFYMNKEESSLEGTKPHEHKVKHNLSNEVRETCFKLYSDLFNFHR